MQYNAQVKWMQTELERLGYDVGSGGADGKFGNDTKKAVFMALEDLQTLKEMQSDTQPVDVSAEEENCYKYTNDLAKGDTGDAVEKLQKLLLRWHMQYYLGKGQVDGDFGSGTQKAVEEFQMGMSMEPTGKVDEKLWDMLNSEPVDILRWITPQKSDNPEDDGKLPFACNCSGKYCDSQLNAMPGRTSVGLMILIERIQNELNRRYDRDDIILKLTDDINTANCDDRNGGNRCTVWNSLHGGAKHSQHTKWCAADLFAYVPDADGKKAPSNYDLWKVADEMNPYGGVGRYGGNIHVDTRGSRGRW